MGFLPFVVLPGIGTGGGFEQVYFQLPLSVWWLWAALMISLVSLEGLGAGSGPCHGAVLPLWCCLSSPPFHREIAKHPSGFWTSAEQSQQRNSQECRRVALLGIWSFCLELYGQSLALQSLRAAGVAVECPDQTGSCFVPAAPSGARAWCYPLRKDRFCRAELTSSP